MKKTYINPEMRVVNLTETDAVLLTKSGEADGSDMQSRHNRWQDDWDDEN